MSRKLESRVIVVDGGSYLIAIFPDRLLIAPCQPVNASFVVFYPASVVAVVPLQKRPIDYMPLEFFEDEVRVLIRLHLIELEAIGRQLSDHLADYLSSGYPPYAMQHTIEMHRAALKPPGKRG